MIARFIELLYVRSAKFKRLRPGSRENAMRAVISRAITRITEVSAETQPCTMGYCPDNVLHKRY